MLLIDKKEFTLRSSGRLVKADEVAAARSAAETLAAAEAEAAPRGGSRALWIALLCLLGAVLLFFALLAILGRTAPQLVDPLLYNSRELETLRQLL